MATVLGTNTTLERPEDVAKFLGDEGIILTQLDKAINGRAKTRSGRSALDSLAAPSK